MPELTGRLLAAATVAGDWPGARAVGSVATNSNNALAGCCAVRGLWWGGPQGWGAERGRERGPSGGRAAACGAVPRWQQVASRTRQEGAFFLVQQRPRNAPPHRQTHARGLARRLALPVSLNGDHPAATPTQLEHRWLLPPPGSPGRPSLGGSSSPHRIHRAAEPEGLETWCRRDQGGTVPASSPETHVPSQLPASPWINGVTRRAGRRE